VNAREATLIPGDGIGPEITAGERISKALRTTIEEDSVRTPDIHGTATTAEFAEAAVRRLD
jgi:isocitrate/isopropylmalate dehydrogenase